MEIRLLNEETISRIAAGEVIERPLNVVKELVENSIDAGSTAVTVEIRDGGISMIRVTDNGCGIEKDQIAKAFVRHATSKIRDAEDLSSLSSLGFRGEALASIASVAQVEMITKVRGAISGTRALNDHLASYSPDAPVNIDLEEIGAPNGTTVIVRNLFGSIPVRKKFLRQPQTEAGYITDLIEKQALSHPNISFHYRVNGQDKLHTTGNGSLKELIYRIYGRETAGAVISIHAEDAEKGMVLDGFLGRPEVSRSSGSFETFFINGRMLRSKELSAGLEEGYRTDLMQHRFPFAVLHLTMNPADVDVNVHPSKMEVRFTDRRAVFQFLNESVHAALHSTELIPRATMNTAAQERALARKEKNLKARQLREAHAPEAFESDRTSQIPGAPSVSYKTESPVRDRNSGSAPSGAGTDSAPTAPGRAFVSPQSGPEVSPRVSSDTADASADNAFVFDDRRSYGSTPEKTFSPPVHRTWPVQEPPQEKSQIPLQQVEKTDGPTQKPFREMKADSLMPQPQGSPESFKKQERNTDSRVQQPQGQSDRSPVHEAEEANPAQEPVQEENGQLTLQGLLTQPAGGEVGHILTHEKAEKFKYIGQVFGTYWIIEYEKKLLIIDQHAAHEKVNYERMMRRIQREHPGLDSAPEIRSANPEDYLSLERLLPQQDGQSSTAGTGKDEGASSEAPVFVASQQLLPPAVIRLSGKEESAYLQYRTVFAAMGYEIEDFGGGSYAIRAVPTELFGQSADSLLRSILEEIMNERISGTPHAIISRVASMSCKAAVKGNSRLSEKEARALIAELLELDNPYHCPHGRPTMIVMSQYEVDRKFKRIL